MTILACWVVGGVLALCGAAAYAELGSMMPRAGGEYVYLREAYHPAVGFMSGWVSLTAGFSAPIAAAAIAFSVYLATLIPALQTAGAVDRRRDHDRTAAARSRSALIVAITALHSFDTKVGGWVQAAFTAAKVLLIVVFIVAGLARRRRQLGQPRDARRGGLANIGTDRVRDLADVRQLRVLGLERRRVHRERGRAPRAQRCRARCCSAPAS